MIKTRFPPSPTGFLHIGGLRTALYSYLFAKKNKGVFMVRIEDTDQERFVEGGIENILRSLTWAGIDIDEGMYITEEGAVLQKGENGPYIQSERLTLYKKYITELLEKGNAYHCFCSKERLDELRKMQEMNKQAPGYDGHCRTLDSQEVKKKLTENTPHTIRLKVPKTGETNFIDLVRGKVTFENKLIDDQVLIKSDGFPTYHFAVVVDDHCMGTTHVIRGEEWLSSTPKHVLLYQMFGWDVPAFGHLSLLVNEQKKKLSKRHGDVSVEDFKEKGYLPEAIVNFIAFLGWNPGDERELFTLKELEREFDLSRVTKAAAVFNREKLDWYNSQYIRKMEIGELTKLCVPFLENSGVVKETGNWKLETWNLEKVVELVKDRMAKLSDLPEMVGFLFAEELVYEAEVLIWKKSTREKTKEVLEELVTYLSTINVQDWNKLILEQKVGEWIKEKGYGVGDVLWPMRVALSGQKNSPPPYDIADILGKDRSIDRIQKAIQKL